jgi:sulfonate transport system permease protein
MRRSRAEGWAYQLKGARWLSPIVLLLLWELGSRIGLIP